MLPFASRLSKCFFVLTLGLLLLGCSRSAPDETPVDIPPVSATTEKIEEGQWILDTENSVVTWSAARIVGNSHTGTVKVKEGILTANDQGIEGGNFVMDMTSITESKNNERFLGHIRSEDFFDIENYPTSEFFITQVIAKLGGVYEVSGDLTLLNQTSPINFTATAAGDGNVLSAQASFSIDRTQWGITYDSGTFFQELADKAIKDEIEFDLNLIFEIPLN